MKVFRRKLVALSLIIALLISFVPTIPVRAEGAVEPSKPTVTLEPSATEIANGREVTVAVKVINPVTDPVQNVLRVVLSYDESVLSVSNVELKNGVGLNSTAPNAENGKQVIRYQGNVTVPEDGVVAVVTFKAISDPAEEGTTINVSALYQNADKENTNLEVANSVTLTKQTVFHVEGLEVREKYELPLNEGAKKLSVKVLPEGISTDIINILWESEDPSIVEVSRTGKTTTLTPKKVGTTKVTASLEGFTATCEVTVTSPLTGLKLNKESLVISVGKDEQLTVVPEPADTTTDLSNITWESSNADVATVDNNGIVHGIKFGTTTITATVNGVTSNVCNVRVLSKEISDIVIKDVVGNEVGTINTTRSQGIILLTLEGVVASGSNLTNLALLAKLTSSDEKVATVANGNQAIVTIVGNGTTTITATYEVDGKTLTKSVVIDVKNPLTGIAIKDDDADGRVVLNPLAESTLEVVYTPSKEETTSSTIVSWTSDHPEWVTVDGNGVIKAVATDGVRHVAKITATSVEKDAEGKNFTATINVVIPAVSETKLYVNKEELNMYKGQVETLSAKLVPESSNKVTTEWKSGNDEIVTVDANGTVTALKKGDTTVTVRVTETDKNGDKTEYTKVINVHVSTRLESISINPNEVTLYKGHATDGSKKLELVLNPEDASVAKSGAVWSSENDEIATVVSNGDGTATVTAVKAGTTVIKAELDGLTATCKVKVDVKLTNVTIEDGASSVNLYEDTQRALVVKTTPEDATVIPEAKWSSNSDAVTVENGVIKAVGKAGEKAIVTVDYGNGVSDTIEVVIVAHPKTGIVFDKYYSELLKGQKVTLGTTVYVNNEVVEDAVIVWSVDNQAVGTVDENGNVRALAEGTFTVTATAWNYKEDGTKQKLTSASMEINVKEVHITAIEVTPKKNPIEEGEKTELEVKCTPSVVTDELAFKYSVSDETIATVDAYGVVTGKKAGEVVVTVTNLDGTISGSTTITVVEKSLSPSGPIKPGTGAGSAGGNVGGGAGVGGAVASLAAATVTSPHTGDMAVEFLVALMIVSLLGIVLVIRKK